MAGNMVKTDLVTEEIGDPGDAVQARSTLYARPPSGWGYALTRAPTAPSA